MRPEDIENVTERYIPMFQEERESDTVNRVHLKETDLFLITLIEHQSKNHYDMTFKLLRYLVVTLDAYSNRELIEKKDELSLIFLLNKLRSSAGFADLKEEIPEAYLEDFSQHTPAYLLKTISKIVTALLLRLKLPMDEIHELTDKIEGRQFQMMFDRFEECDLPEARRIARREGHAEGHAEGRMYQLIEQTVRKLRKDYSAVQIAEMLDEDLGQIESIYQAAVQCAPEYDTEQIYHLMRKDTVSSV